MKNTGLSASSKKIILFLVLAQFFCFKNFSLDFSRIVSNLVRNFDSEKSHISIMLR